MQGLTRFTIFLCCAWALTVLYGEMGAYWIPFWSCSWPQPPSNSSSAADQVKVAAVADPQLMGRTSFGLYPKSLALEAVQFYSGPLQGAQTFLSWEFIKNMSNVNSLKPRVLLTHIPLYHADETPCGPHRSSPVINQILVLSDHDHDQCMVTPSTPSDPVTELAAGKPVSIIHVADCNVSLNHKQLNKHGVCSLVFFSDANPHLHLGGQCTWLRKPQHGPIAKSDLGSVGRGNVTIRQTAKKTVVQEPETSVSVDMSSTKMPRPSKSKARKFIGREIRVLQLPNIIAAINVPLYMMLLFKDWIDR